MYLKQNFFQYCTSYACDSASMQSTETHSDSILSIQSTNR